MFTSFYLCINDQIPRMNSILKQKMSYINISAIYNILIKKFNFIKICFALLIFLQQGHSMEPVTTITAYLLTRMPPCGPMSFATMAASSRICRGYHTCQKQFWLFFRLTFSWLDPYSRNTK